MRNYLKKLVSGLAAQAPEHIFVLFSPRSADVLLGEFPPNVECVYLGLVPTNRSLRILYQQTGLVLAIENARLDVFLATATVAPIFTSIPVVLVVQFLQFYHWPEGYGRVRTSYLKCMLPWSLRKARQVITFTESAKKDLVALTSVAPSKVHVVPHGVSPDIFQSTESHQVNDINRLTGGRPYILYVSATYSYKNHVRLIRAFGILKQKCAIPHALVFVGSEVDVSFSHLKSIALLAGVATDVICAGRLESQTSVAAAYRGAEVATMPSLYETFGYPAIEAMLCGCPVVTSNCGSMAEIGSGAAVLVDPLDENSIADGLRSVLESPTLRQRLIRDGQIRAHEFTWERSVRGTLDALRDAVEAS